MPLVVVGGFALIIGGGLGYSLLTRQPVEFGRREGPSSANSASPADVLGTAPPAGVVSSPSNMIPTSAPVPAAPPNPPSNLQGGATNATPQDPVESARQDAWMQYWRRKAQLEQAQDAARAQALASDTSVRNRGVTEAQSGPMANSPPPNIMTGPAGPQGSAQMYAGGFAGSNYAAMGGGGGGYGQGNPFGPQGFGAAGLDPRGQGSQRAFLAGGGRAGSHYLPNTVEQPLSPYEVKAGHVISGIMLGGISSDLPGQIHAQVAQNVCDSATGRHLLIPQGARIVGTYDNTVVTGQRRILVRWDRIIYPDSQSLDIGGMPGADQSGYAGFYETVNNHWAENIGNALLLSLFSAGAQLSQPAPVYGEGLNSGSIASAALGQQLSQLGMEYARRGLRVPPTLETSPGYQFAIMVNKDMILQPWRGHPMADGPVRGCGT